MREVEGIGQLEWLEDELNSDNVSHITNTETFGITNNQLHVAGNEYQENENDCKIDIIIIFESFLVSSKFKNDSETMITTSSSILNFYNIEFDQIIGTLMIVLTINMKISSKAVIICNNIVYDHIALFFINANNLVVFKNVSFGHYNVAMQHNLKDDYDISKIFAAAKDKEISKVTVKRVFQGMRSVKSLICETSELDTNEGIRFR